MPETKLAATIDNIKPDRILKLNRNDNENFIGIKVPET